jgi:FixJ family two-component response regulator
MPDISQSAACIAIVDDDASVRSAVARLLRSYDFICATYDCAESALADPQLAAAQCAIIDVQLSGMNGFAFRDCLVRQGIRIPYLFITAHPETGSPEWVQAVGDVPCIRKPFDGSQLLAAIQLVSAGRH